MNIGPQRAAPKSVAAIESEVAQYRKFADFLIAGARKSDREELEALRDLVLEDMRAQPPEPTDE